jgi:hypothetical protein
VVESFEPRAVQTFGLTVKGKDPAALKLGIEDILRRNRLEFEMRTTTQDELTYEVRVPLDKKIDRISSALLRIDPDNTTGVEWDEKKDKKK